MDERRISRVELNETLRIFNKALEEHLESASMILFCRHLRSYMNPDGWSEADVKALQKFRQRARLSLEESEHAYWQTFLLSREVSLS